MIPAARARLVVLSAALLGALALMPDVFALTQALPESAARPDTASTGKIAVSRQDLAPILDFAPFGEPVGSGDLPVSDTSGGTVLKGVLLSSDPAASVALISVGAGKVEPYRQGQTLPDGAYLDQIGPSHVSLLRDGVTESLTFPLPSASPSTVQQSALTEGGLVAQPMPQTDLRNLVLRDTVP